MRIKYFFILSVLIIQADSVYAGAAVQRTRQIERQQEAYQEAVRQQMIQQRQQQEAQAYQQAVEQRRSQMQQAYRQAYQNAVEDRTRQQQQAYVSDALAQKANQERQVYQQALQQRAYQGAAYQKAAYEQAAIEAQTQQQAYQYAAQRQAYQQAAVQQQAYGQIAQQQVAASGILYANAPYPDMPEEPQDVADINQIVAELDITSEIWPLIMDFEPKVMIIDYYIKRFAKQRTVIRKESSFYVQMIDSMIFGNPEMLKTPLENILKVAAIAEYDFDNGQDKDRMARQILGEAVYQENRKRLGR